MKRFLTALFAATLLMTAGCATDYEQTIQEPAIVTPTTSKTLYLIVNKPLNNTDDAYNPSEGIVFLIGKYMLEAEDINYWYFRAPKPIIVATYDFGKQTSGTRFYGGIAISKRGDNTKPTACAYTDESTKDKNNKIRIWRMSDDFQKQRGIKWALCTDKVLPGLIQAKDSDGKSDTGANLKNDSSK
jgi:hypothetical protein